MVTINNILNVFINESIRLEPGIVIQTPQYPQGCRVFVRVGCLLGDLVANHKVAGFAAHSDTQFCSWCDSPKADIQQLQVERLQQKWNRWKWDFEKVELNENEDQEHDSGDDCEMQDGNKSAQEGPSWQKANKMMSALSNVKVPFGVTHIPQWLGQEKEGKIKASEWQSLFSIYLPLAEINILLGDIDKLLEKPNETGKNCILINSFSALVACTHFGSMINHK
ncbi:hypothetical protein O181_090690 [Austropuccinia psidii MF-1]|uniref:Uncharacterized protein n=1 Tax=Austropuccinia psidii MF-1 TaxID=1389203 RepID=A0A9Q3IWA4_9BASI|nr:hypothetical protein [Austropuccinia psidii MF-1]